MMGDQDTTSAIGIADLPLDVLRQIFAFFEPSYGNKNGKIDFHALKSFFGSDEYRTIKNARLTCWALNVAATPLLFPILHISLEQESLERAKSLCSNPLIYSGIRGVQICLTYRPGETANSLQRYKECRLRELQSIYDTHGQSAEEAYDSRWPYGDQGESDALHFSTLRRAWNAMSNTKHILSDEEKLYQNLLTESYETYKRQHEAQARLVSEKVFVSTISSLLAGLDHPLSLNIVSYPPRVSRSHFMASQMPLASRSNFLQFMNAPHDWDIIAKLTGGPNGFNLSKLLVDLPIACHEAGTTPQHLYIDCFPLSGHSIGNGQGGGMDWERLSAASRSIKTFHFGSVISPRKNTSTRRFWPTLDQGFVDKFLGSIVSSPSLDDCSLNLDFFGLRCGGWTKHGVMTFDYNIDAAISRICSHKLNILRLAYVSVEEKNLEWLCENLAEEPEALELRNVHFTKGSNWITILDQLSVRLASVISEEKCRVTFSHLS
ncbi:unnamed protein product [Clonostachys rosea]|uniref:F-box domain-containing protein n=1 Tax=Bionectria ochroleuca TaxID=29856 RepID=A0ABY6UIF0_BIOOC|nr:unnamed protein product [Clonostachys rosea]